MFSQNPSQIYKASLRGHEEDENYRCLSTLNFGSYFEETRKPFGNLKVLNDETLAAQQTKLFSISENTQIILIPLVGTIEYKDDFGNNDYINTEEIQVVQMSKETTFQLRNPFENELINYLQIRLKLPQNASTVLSKKSFDFHKRNKLFPLLENENFKISIGIFDGRNEGIYSLQNEKKGIFAFVIAGAFEFQNRLVETRDALAIWEVSEIEFESLSENAILLLIETTLQDYSLPL